MSKWWRCDDDAHHVDPGAAARAHCTYTRPCLDPHTPIARDRLASVLRQLTGIGDDFSCELHWRETTEGDETIFTGLLRAHSAQDARASGSRAHLHDARAHTRPLCTCMKCASHAPLTPAQGAVARGDSRQHDDPLSHTLLRGHLRERPSLPLTHSHPHHTLTDHSIRLRWSWGKP